MKPKAHAVPGSIQLIEEATHVLRQCPVSLLAAYYIGTLPFMIRLLYFWADMSRSASAADRLTTASMTLALLFVWMKFWQSLFVQGIKARLGRETLETLSAGSILRTAGVQSIIHGSGLILLPLSLVLALPFGWVFAFYQSAHMPDRQETPGLRGTCRAAWRMAWLWPGQNHLVLAVFSLLGGVLFINFGLTLLFIPHLIKSLLGIETVFTLSGIHLLNTTFLATVLCLSWLAMDPLVKTVYALRCYYGLSLRTGEDIRSELRTLKRRRRAGTVLVSFLCLLGFCGPFCGTAIPAEKRPSSDAAVERSRISPEGLDRSIEQVLKRREFAWRMPRTRPDEAEEEIKGPIASILEGVVGGVWAAMKRVGGWIKAIYEWLEGLFPKPDPPSEESRGREWMPSVRSGLIALLVVVCCALVFFLIRTLMIRKHRQAAPPPEPTATPPDLNDQDLTADALPRDRWMTLAEEMMQKGALREALRAMYLGTLAGLGEHGVITLARHKSNRDYREELKRRAHDRDELQVLFAANVELFDRVWYGRFRLTPDDLRGFHQNHERISSLVHI